MGSRRNAPKPTASNQREDGLLVSKYVPPDEEHDRITTAEGELFGDSSAITEPPAPAWSLESLLGSTALIASFDQFPDPVALGVFTLQEVDVLYGL